MIAITASLVVILYLIVPGVLFRRVFSFFLPLRQFQGTRIQELEFGAITSIVPLALAISVVLLGANGLEKLYAQSEEYRALLAGLYDSGWFTANQNKFWSSLQVLPHVPLSILLWCYALSIGEGLLVGSIAYKFPDFWFSRRILSKVSEWYLLLELYPKGTDVVIDLLGSNDVLYQGKVGDYFLDTQGNLSGLYLTGARRFNRHRYLKDRESKIDKETEEYWRLIPGQNLYFPADKIMNALKETQEDIEALFDRMMNITVEATFELEQDDDDEN